MQRVTTQGIVLSRTNFGEADRIITFLTPNNGKVSGMVKGVRKVKSKLAGGIELFSVSDITYIPGRGETATVISTRLVRHYGSIVKDLSRTNAGYELIKTLNKATEENTEPDYFVLLDQAFAALDDESVDLDIIKVWFTAQLVKLAGHTPNLKTDNMGNNLSAEEKYDFDLDNMSFAKSSASRRFGADEIKFLRLLFSSNPPKTLSNISGSGELAAKLLPLLNSMLAGFVRI